MNAKIEALKIGRLMLTHGFKFSNADSVRVETGSAEISAKAERVLVELNSANKIIFWPNKDSVTKSIKRTSRQSNRSLGKKKK